MTEHFKCPECGYPQVCGCPSCKDKIPEGILPYKWEGDYIICAGCGFKAHIDWWEDKAYRQFKDKIEENVTDKKDEQK